MDSPRPSLPDILSVCPHPCSRPALPSLPPPRPSPCPSLPPPQSYQALAKPDNFPSAPGAQANGKDKDKEGSGAHRLGFYVQKVRRGLRRSLTSRWGRQYADDRRNCRCFS